MTAEHQASTNYGTSAWLQHGDDGGANHRRGYYLFDTAPLPDNAIIDNAVLNLYVTAVVGTPTLELLALDNTNWDENVVTWNDAPAHGQSLENDTKTGTGWETWTILDPTYLQAQHDANDNIGLVIKLQSEVSPNERQIVDSKEDAGGDFPYLTINYTENAGAPPAGDNTTIYLQGLSTTGGEDLIDRDNDGYLTETSDVELRIFIYDNNGWDNYHAYLSIIDNDGVYMLENENLGPAPFQQTENVGRHKYTYSPEDNTISDSALGNWDVEIYMVDIVYWAENTCSDDENGCPNMGVFAVTDFGFTGVDVVTQAGHSTLWDFACFTTGYLVGGINQAPEYVTIVDNNIGTYRSPKGSGAHDPYHFENTYNDPTAPGEFYAYAFENNIDGALGTQTYEVPNITPTWQDFAVENALVDNHASDNAITSLYIEAVFIDQDGFDDFDNSTFWIALYDNAGNLV